MRFGRPSRVPTGLARKPYWLRERTRRCCCRSSTSLLLSRAQNRRSSTLVAQRGQTMYALPLPSPTPPLRGGANDVRLAPALTHTSTPRSPSPSSSRLPSPTQIISKNPGVLACNPVSLEQTPMADIERAANFVYAIDTLPPNIKSGIPFLTLLAIVGTVGTRLVQCGGGACGDEWDLQGGLGPQLVRALSSLIDGP